MLLANGSKEDDTDGQGRTPLTIAAQQGETNVLEVLIKNEPNRYLKPPKYGRAALHIAALHDQVWLVQKFFC